MEVSGIVYESWKETQTQEESEKRHDEDTAKSETTQNVRLHTSDHGNDKANSHRTTEQFSSVWGSGWGN